GLARISDPPGGDRREARELVASEATVGQDVDDAPTAGGQRVADETTVAPSPVPLGAHERRPPLRAEGLQQDEPARELIRLHVVRIASKGGDAPGVVRGVAAGLAATAELLAEPLVGDPGAGELRRQRLRGEMRIAARAGEAPHVGHGLDPGPANELSESF